MDWTWTQFVILVILIEAITETLKPIWDEEKRDKKILKDKLIVLGISILIVVLAGKGLFDLVGLSFLIWANAPPVAGLIIDAVLTGIIASRGSNYAHDLWKLIAGLVSPK